VTDITSRITHIKTIKIRSLPVRYKSLHVQGKERPVDTDPAFCCYTATGPNVLSGNKTKKSKDSIPIWLCNEVERWLSSGHIRSYLRLWRRVQRLGQTNKPNSILMK